VAKILAEAHHERREEGIGDRKLHVVELIGEGLEAQEEGVEGEIVLLEAKNSCWRKVMRWILSSVKRPVIFFHTSRAVLPLRTTV
jgi:hypothetical protein